MLSLARESMVSALNGRTVPVQPDGLPRSLRKRRACFVTLSISGQLRGCIGRVVPVQQLWQDVVENSRAAAFSDPRFKPLTPAELSLAKITISVLTIPKPLQYSSSDELVRVLEQRKPGVIVKQGRCQATFLAQVWEELPSAEAFLSRLCEKAGLMPDAWKRGIGVEVYEVEKVGG